MVSKKERRRWLKYVQQASLTELKLISRMLQEIEFERRVRNKALRMAKKHKPSDYIA